MVKKKEEKSEKKTNNLGLKLSVNALPELLEPVRIDATERESSSLDVFICSIFINIDATGSGTFFSPSISPLLLTLAQVPPSAPPTLLEVNDSLVADNGDVDDDDDVDSFDISAMIKLLF